MALNFPCAALAYLTATSLRPRGGIELTREYAGGRYAYLPSLAWCASLGAIVEPFAIRLSGRAYQATIGVVVVALARFVIAQRQLICPV